MERCAWRAHVREELRRRERRGRGLRALLESQQTLQDRLQALCVPDGAPSVPRRTPAQDSLWTRLEVEQLRREKEELQQQIALIRDVLREAEAENQQQRLRVGRLTQDVATLKRCLEELQSQAWLSSQEARGLRQELGQVRVVLQETCRARQQLEVRWMQEKVLEAERLNWANEREERYRQKVIRLQEKLEQLGEAVRRSTSSAGSGRGSEAERSIPAKPATS